MNTGVTVATEKGDAAVLLLCLISVILHNLEENLVIFIIIDR